MGSDTPESVRPATKRIRSDQDHSKASVKADEASKENQKNGAEGDDKQEEDEDKHNDDEWLKKPPFRVGESREGWKTKWRESCWCGKTAFAYDADPLQAKMCHCEDCQRLHGAPAQLAAVFKKDNVRLDSGHEWIGFMSAHGEVHPLSATPSPLPRKISCRACGSPLMDEGRNMIMAFPPAFEWTRTHKEVKKQKGEGEHNEPGKGEVGMPKVFQPQCHIFYERRVVDVKDGLPKWRGHKEESEQMGDSDI
ncbi:hypothetical protein IAU60_002812 [Kwoniella sp. DSM 27419]